ncbi:DUF1449 domain-containing protein [Photobacterium aphoticum]|uniref:DUF1449 domain-containing protein n=1 Tax=Photobacterium aphoticum TaxID=754436 RepID=A0A0J1GSA5_9GAMM|nr:hypothetical protein [Photobacterium aphoticum]KLV02304.1 hypothetical protein ABT58_03930 [Photobacterium aphoticum]PSU56284.1 DUF1449 domain-containing protein [Photobacterium aphoticum]
MDVFFSALLSYPVAVFFIPFCIFAILMVVDLLLNISEAGADGDIDGSWATTLFLPPVIAQIPLPITLCISTFVATIITYYLDRVLLSHFDGLILTVITGVALLIILYVALFVSAQLLRPLAPLLCKENSFAVVTFEGKRAFVRSASVTHEHGEAIITDAGNELQIDIYNNINEDIHYGDEVLILSKNEDTGRYLVSKITD